MVNPGINISKIFFPIAVLMLCLSYSYTNAEKKADHPLSRFVLSEQDSEKFTIARGPNYYGPESLWNYINGGALPYLDYGVKDVVTYAGQWKPEKLEIVIDVYDMADSLGAFGIYSNERFPEYTYLDVGIEGYITENALCFWKDRYYIKIISQDDDPKTLTPLIELARTIENRIPDGGGNPWFFSLFPNQDKLDRTESFTAKNVLGQDYLANAFSANYRRGKEEFQYFLITADNAQAAHENFTAYKEFLTKYGEMTDKKVSIGDEAFIGKESWYGTVLFIRKGAIILCSVGLSDEKLAKKHLETMTEALP